MVQANGGNDTIDVTGSIIESTVYGGQGTITSPVLMLVQLRSLLL